MSTELPRIIDTSLIALVPGRTDSGFYRNDEQNQRLQNNGWLAGVDFSLDQMFVNRPLPLPSKPNSGKRGRSYGRKRPSAGRCR
jgi:hypothetical protein